MYMYIYPLPLPPIPPFQIVTEFHAGLHMLYNSFPLIIYFTHDHVYMSLLLFPFVLTSPSCCRRKRQSTPVLLPGKSHTRFLWQVTVHGVTNSRTQLSNFTFLSFSPSRAETQVLHEGSYLSIDGLVRNQPLLQFLLPCTQAHARSQRGQGLKQKN